MNTPCYKQFLLGLEEPEKSADAEKSEILRWLQICKSETAEKGAFPHFLPNIQLPRMRSIVHQQKS